MRKKTDTRTMLLTASPLQLMISLSLPAIIGMETTLAHLLPEMTSNIVAPILILIYLFVLDWRMALLSLVSIPVGMIANLP